MGDWTVEKFWCNLLVSLARKFLVIYFKMGLDYELDEI